MLHLKLSGLGCAALHSRLLLDILCAPAHRSHLSIMSDLNHTLPNGHCVSPKSLTSYQLPYGNSQQPNGAGDAAFNGGMDVAVVRGCDMMGSRGLSSVQWCESSVNLVAKQRNRT